MIREMVATIARRRRHAGMSYADAARAAGMTPGDWLRLEMGHRSPMVPTLEKMAGAVGMELALTPDHLRPFLDLDPAEAYELLQIAQHYRRNVRQPAEVLVTLAAKLDRWMRVRRPAGRPRKMETAA